ncbi:regulatory protein RecX [Solimonas terrae]|uniref:Regulatory protein RecX n=1 Tax=Solimonas terrae TaxID=1396819 RepID=A0A6M2BRW4_9GAMM|nr:regulatory protein RecX [Solimonas terrae]
MRKPRPPSKRTAERTPLDAGAARERALKLLSRREHSAAELAFKLQRRGAEAGIALAAVAKVQDAGLQSDARYAEMLVRNRIEQGYGPLRIRAELAAAGIAESVARDALTAAGCDWGARCAELRRRKFRTAPKGAAEWQKQYRYLASHGYTADTIRAVLKTSPMPEEDWTEPFEG